MDSPPLDGYVIQNMGRKIFTRTGLSISFLHTKQVLADRIVIHTPGQSDLLYVRIICHHGDEKEEGYITMVNEEDFTLGYNCELKHKMLNIPKVAVAVSISHEDETLVERTRRHTNRFSILARDDSGENILGFLNDRFKNHHDLRNSWIPGTGLAGILRPRIDTPHWPTILSVCVATAGLVIVAICLIRSGTLLRIWPCYPSHASSNSSLCSRSTHTTAAGTL